MTTRLCFILCLLGAAFFVGCHNDRKIVDKHEQTLQEEDE